MIGATYFITLCSRNRAPGLTHPLLAEAIHAEVDAIAADGHWTWCCVVILPDHVHLLVRLEGALTLSRCLSRLKAKSRRLMSQQGLSWQGNYYEHRLRRDESVATVLHYMFLNPYRAGIADGGEPYPWFRLGSDESKWFLPQTDDGRPFPEWFR